MEHMKKKELKAFEKNIIERYLNQEILSPVHLSGGNEDQLIQIFKDVKPDDWIFTTYRSHYHALLKGMPKEEVLEWVLDNKSIHLMNKEHKIVSSALVGGVLPQALGTALAIKEKWGEANIAFRLRDDGYEDGVIGTVTDVKPHVWVFVGDMTATLGVFKDCHAYAVLNDLPITFVIEDNGLSTDTPTAKAWGTYNTSNWCMDWNQPKIIYYQYERIYPHYGVGKRIEFKT